MDVGFEQTFDLHDRANHLRLADAVGKGSAIYLSNRIVRDLWQGASAIAAEALSAIAHGVDCRLQLTRR